MIQIIYLCGVSDLSRVFVKTGVTANFRAAVSRHGGAECGRVRAFGATMPARCRANKIEVSMKRLSKVLGQGSDGAHWFMCPACDSPVRIKGWKFDGNVERPTFSPSVLTTMPAGKGKYVCHSFVRDGKIQFLGDCTHELKGQTVDLPEIPDWILSE